MGLRTAVLTGKAVQEFEPMGDGTLCAVATGTVLPPSDTFPIKNYAGERQCKTWSGDATPYDQLDYKSWLSSAPTPTFRRRHQRARRSAYAPALAQCYETCRMAGSQTCADLGCCPSNTTDGFANASLGFYVCQADACHHTCNLNLPYLTGVPLFEVRDGAMCTEWRCSRDSLTGNCKDVEKYCHRAERGTMKKPTWATWIQGEDTLRDAKCITWICHDQISKPRCDDYRCAWSNELKVCAEYHPTLVDPPAQPGDARPMFETISGDKIATKPVISVEACRLACNNAGKDNCTAFHFQPSVMRQADQCSAKWCPHTNKKQLTWTDVDGDGVEDPLCYHFPTQTWAAQSSVDKCPGPGHDRVGNKALEFKTMPTCTLYNTPLNALVSTKLMPGSLTLDTDSALHSHPTPLKGQCFRRRSNVSRTAANAHCFKEMTRPHSETQCRTTTPMVDKFGGVDWQKQASIGDLWTNHDGLDIVPYGPGLAAKSGFDAPGWTFPLVTNHDYIIDFGGEDDFEQFTFRWSLPWILQNPDTGLADASVPPDARFSGAKDSNPLPDENVLLSFAYLNYRYRFKVDTPSRRDMPWFDVHSDDCAGTVCSVRGSGADAKRTRGDITRNDAFGVSMMAREDESLQSTYPGGLFKIAINPWYGVDTCAARPAPSTFQFTTQAHGCPPSICSKPRTVDYKGVMYWSNASTWEAIAFGVKQDPLASDTATVPVEWAVVEIPAGYCSKPGKIVALLWDFHLVVLCGCCASS